MLDKMQVRFLNTFKGTKYFVRESWRTIVRGHRSLDCGRPSQLVLLSCNSIEQILSKLKHMSKWYEPEA